MHAVPGIIGFIFFIVFDLNKIYWNSRALNLSFVLGAVLLIGSTGYCVKNSDFAALLAHFGIWQIITLLGLLLSAAALVYVLFFALPFEDTYMESEGLPLMDKGVYGACRHPGFWMFALCYLFLALFCSNMHLLYCGIIYSICNFLYIVIQDIYIFPKYIQGYQDYKKTVPFLVPTGKSLRSAFTK